MKFKDAEFMSAAEKAKVLKAWVAFLKSGLAKSKFTAALYHHLTQNCALIAHHDKDTFYSCFFAPHKRSRWGIKILDQFDPDKCGESPSGAMHWLRADDYKDVNEAMREAARPFLHDLRKKCRSRVAIVFEIEGRSVEEALDVLDRLLDAGLIQEVITEINAGDPGLKITSANVEEA